MNILPVSTRSPVAEMQRPVTQRMKNTEYNTTVERGSGLGIWGIGSGAGADRILPFSSANVGHNAQNFLTCFCSRVMLALG